MSDSSTPLHDAVAEGDAGQLRALLLKNEFVLLSTIRSEDDPEENVGALTAEIESMEVLLVFSGETSAANFVQQNDDLFEEDEEVDGILVDGDALLDYLPDGFGILFDPETDDALIIEPKLLSDVKSLGS